MNHHQAIFVLLRLKKNIKIYHGLHIGVILGLKDSTRANIGKVRKKIEGSFEKKIVELSDRFIFVTKANQR